MKADLSRGHRPDRKRGKDYRRVLLQQGRVLLDSDLAATTDALDTGLRTLARNVAGESGTHDQGFLITPGRLMALFETLDGVTRDASSQALFKHYLDYGRRYQGRLPSLYLGGLLAWGKVTVALRSAPRPGTKLRLWACLPSGAKLVVGMQGVPDQQVTGSDAQAFKPYDITVPVGTTPTAWLNLSFANPAASPDPTREAWIGLIEEFETAAGEPRFWVKRGHYLLGGYPLTLQEDGSFPSVTFPAGLLHDSQATPDKASPGQRFLAFLEGWERLVTHVEDPGLLEQALGGTLDTCARTQAVGQVKLVACPAGLTPAQVLNAFRTVKAPKGTLQIGTASQSTSADPCAIPEAEGYTGGDNRLYRFEVHEWTQGTGLGSFSLKWSRNNGAEVFRVVSKTDFGIISRLGLAPGANLRDGDLVEFLDERVELGDHTPAALDGTGFTPSRRAAGALYYVREVLEDLGQIELIDPATGAPIWLAYSMSETAIPKLRRWHGLLKSGEGTASGDTLVFTVDGIEVKVGGPAGGADLFRPGDYWQYEARKLYANDNGAWVASPHGPERLHAPLALFEFKGPDLPVELVEWYGGRGSPLFELEADDVAFNGARAGTSATTVQGALDELFQRQGGGCCQVETGPEPIPTPTTDDAARINNLILTKLPKGGVICLRPGVYYFRSQLSIAGMPIELRGCPDAVIVSDAAGKTPIVVGTGGALLLSGLVVCTRSTSPGPALIEVSGNASLTVKECGLFHVGPTTGPVNPGTAILTPGTIPSSFTFNAPPYELPYPFPEGSSSTTNAPTIQIDDSVILARWGILASNLKSITMNGTIGHCGNGVVRVEEELAYVHLSGCGLHTDVPNTVFDSLRASDPLAIQHDAQVLLEKGWDYADPAGMPLLVRDLFGGVVTDSWFFGALGFCARFATRLELRGNHYTGTSGLRLDNVTRSKLIGEQLEVWRSDSLEPDGSPVGIFIVRSALGLLIADCDVRTSGTANIGGGIILATNYLMGIWYGSGEGEGEEGDTPNQPPQERRFQDVFIHDNRIRSVGAGIKIRSEFDSEAPGSVVDRISIRGNDIELVGERGIYYRHTTGTLDEKGESAQVVIADNQIRGRGSEWFNLQVIMVQNATMGIMAVEGNTIQFQASASERSIDALRFFFVDSVRVARNRIDVRRFTAGDYEDCGMAAWYCQDMVFSGNELDSAPGNKVVPAEFNSCERLVLEGNTLGAFYKSFRVYYCSNVVVRGNRARCHLFLYSLGGNALLADNFVEHGGGAVETVLSENGNGVAGTHLYAMVSDSILAMGNRVTGGHLAIYPNVIYVGGAPREHEVTLHVEGNFAGTVTVGNYTATSVTGIPNGAFATPVSGTRAMVVNNMATNLIKTNTYNKLLMTNNMAPSLRVGSGEVGSTSSTSNSAVSTANNLRQ
ncbi:DUF6519 domain-containing protein [Cystobacter ferrugineus]|uniref:Right handed beta helix domain-containing protein n=1 Tax=Cystobacter ferrugineus TaxID=83449 RepID=A0A1L9AWY0_9BACT|nr:DUF6519 domain-containing protein [Cystobacter ferrugineus]OJH34518.1 hypothetical protein BON30_42675 [Cystobacter ferrugineus]